MRLNLFHETTWSKVRAGDIVLLPGVLNRIVKAEIKVIAFGPENAHVVFDFGGLFNQSFDQGDTVYVQSRF